MADSYTICIGSRQYFSYSGARYTVFMADDKELRAERLRLARTEAGFSNATEAAERFGWEVVTYRSHENGIRGIKPTVGRKYAGALKVSWSWLMTGEGDMRGPGVEAEIMALPEEQSKYVLGAVRQMLDAIKAGRKL